MASKRNLNIHSNSCSCVDSVLLLSVCAFKNFSFFLTLNSLIMICLSMAVFVLLSVFVSCGCHENIITKWVMELTFLDFWRLEVWKEARHPLPGLWGEESFFPPPHSGEHRRSSTSVSCGHTLCFLSPSSLCLLPHVSQVPPRSPFFCFKVMYRRM